MYFGYAAMYTCKQPSGTKTLLLKFAVSIGDNGCALASSRFRHRVAITAYRQRRRLCAALRAVQHSARPLTPSTLRCGSLSGEASWAAALLPLHPSEHALAAAPAPHRLVAAASPRTQSRTRSSVEGRTSSLRTMTRATSGVRASAAPGTRAGPVRHTRAPPPLPSPRSWMRGTRGPQQQPQPLSLPPASAHAIMMSDEQGRVGRIAATAAVSAPGDPLYGLAFTVTGLGVLKARASPSRSISAAMHAV